MKAWIQLYYIDSVRYCSCLSFDYAEKARDLWIMDFKHELIWNACIPRASMIRPVAIFSVGNIIEHDNSANV